jgi:hypothetical protein
MSSETDTKKLLKFRQSMEGKINDLEYEITRLKTAIKRIDRIIVMQGFKQPTVPPIQKNTRPETIVSEESTSINSKDGTLLGKMRVEGQDLTFQPIPKFEFYEDVPPFKSFFVERVLENMKSIDQERAGNGDIELGDILDYYIEIAEGKIISISIKNYGGERRLWEINSSLRWTFDKMYDKVIRGHETDAE